MPNMQSSNSSFAILQFNSHRSPQLKKQPYALNALHHQQTAGNGGGWHRQKPITGNRCVSANRFNNENQRKMEALNYWKKAFQPPQTTGLTASKGNTNVTNARYIRYYNATKQHNGEQKFNAFPVGENTTENMALKKSQFLKTLSPIQNSPHFILASERNKAKNFEEDARKAWNTKSNSCSSIKPSSSAKKNSLTSLSNDTLNGVDNSNCYDDDDSLIFSIEL